jgi:hypothetical protein
VSAKTNHVVFTVLAVALLICATVKGLAEHYDLAACLLVMGFWCRWESVHP